jgi:hypothetical protein
MTCTICLTPQLNITIYISLLGDTQSLGYSCLSLAISLYSLLKHSLLASNCFCLYTELDEMLHLQYTDEKIRLQYLH